MSDVSLNYLAANVAFLCEEFWPSSPTQFDPELDDAVALQALARGTMRGHCNVSASDVTFSVTDANLRENVIADVGGAGTRHRLMACGLSLALTGHPLTDLTATADLINTRGDRLLLAETMTPFHHALKAAVRPDLLITSEYFGDSYQSGDFVGGVRHEDLQQTSFASDSLDFVLTSDVMEHVPDALRAEREIIRILRPGGFYCFTVPLDAMGERDLVYARLREDGSIEYLAEPTYHGDPLRAEGALVYRIFSVREMTARFASLGATCVTYRLWSKGYGLVGPGCWVHVVRKAE
jgi:SAM-dependent methyltransferase